MKHPVIILGGGGHSRVLIEALKLRKVKILGITDPVIKAGEKISGVPVIGTDDSILKFKPSKVVLVNGLGTVKVNDRRETIFSRFKSQGYTFLSVIHPSAVVASNTKLEEGVQIMAGCVIQPGVIIQANSIINTGASIDHDCWIGPHVHIAPGAVLCGSVQVHEGCHIGTGAVIIQERVIGPRTLVRAGQTVIRHLGKKTVLAGRN